MNGRPFTVPADDLPEPMLLVSPDGAVLAVNRAAREDLGLGAGSPATHLCDLVADAPEKVLAFLRLCSTTGGALPGALGFHTPGGTLECRCDGHRTAGGMVSLRCRPKDASNRAFTVLNEKIAELAREVAVRMGTEERLRELLASREVLVQELHHRIRNSLQVAISLAGLQMRHAPDGPTREQFLRHGHRLKAIGLVYRTLYRDRDLARLDVDGFIGDLCAELGRAYRGTGTAFSIRAEATLLDLDQAVPFALVANELVTNALVHAFGPGDRGTVEVGLHRLPTGLVELTVADDGIGIAPGLLEAAGGGTGLGLVRALARQLGASVAVEHSAGTVFRVAFRDAAAGPMGADA